VRPLLSTKEMIVSFAVGDFFLRPDGKIDVVRMVARAINSYPERLFGYVESQAENTSDCEPVTSLDQLIPDAQCGDRFGSRAGRAGFIVECHCTTLWGTGIQVITPCCGDKRRVQRGVQTITCPSCGWYWQFIDAPGGSRWFSKGYGKKY
jgi:hypothetical protein